MTPSEEQVSAQPAANAHTRSPLGTLPGPLLAALWPAEHLAVGLRVCKVLRENLHWHAEHRLFRVNVNHTGTGLELIHRCWSQFCNPNIKICLEIVADVEAPQTPQVGAESVLTCVASALGRGGLKGPARIFTKWTAIEDDLQGLLQSPPRSKVASPIQMSSGNGDLLRQLPAVLLERVWPAEKTGVGVLVSKWLRESLGNTSLSHLSLTYSDLTIASAPLLTRLLQGCPSLTHLDFHGSGSLFHGWKRDPLGFPRKVSIPWIFDFRSIFWGTEWLSTSISSNLRHLDLGATQIHLDLGATLMKQISKCTNLTFLDLSQMTFSRKRPLENVLRSCTKLEGLVLHECDLDQLSEEDPLISKDMEFLAEALPRRLKKLDLGANFICSPGLQHVSARLVECEHLTAFNLDMTHMMEIRNDPGFAPASEPDEELITAVAGLITALQSSPQLADLNLSGALLRGASMDALITFLEQSTALTALDLNACENIGNRATRRLAAVLPPGLVRLSLARNIIRDAGLQHLAVFLSGCTALTELNLERHSQTWFPRGSAAVLRALQSCRELTVLNLCGLSVVTDSKALTPLIAVLSSSHRLRSLNLANNTLNLGLGRIHVLDLAFALGRSSALTHLDLSRCSLKAECMAVIARELRQCRSLRHLNVSSNLLTDGGIAVFEHGFSTLGCLDLRKNGISRECVVKLEQAGVKVRHDLNASDDEW